MKIAYGVADITPYYSMELVGFTPSRMSSGVESDLQIKVILLQDETSYYGFMVTDLLGNSLFLRDRIIADLGVQGLDLKDLQIFSTHTHSGPRVLKKKEYEASDQDKGLVEYFDFLCQKSVKAFLSAKDRLEDFSYRIARGRMKDFQSNRIDYTFPYDNEILTVEVTTETKQFLIYSFGGHPTILDAKSTLISPDYVGVLDRLLAQHYDFSIFFNAPCGDISSREYRKESSIAELERLGKQAYHCVMETLTHLDEKKTLKKYQVSDHRLDLKLKDIVSEETALQDYEKAKASFREFSLASDDLQAIRKARIPFDIAAINLWHARSFDMDNYESYHIHRLCFDEHLLYTLTGEVLSELLLPLKEKYPQLWFISLADQYTSYLPNQKAYDISSYEAMISLYQRGEGERVRDWLLDDMQKTCSES